MRAPEIVRQRTTQAAPARAVARAAVPSRAAALVNVIRRL